MADEVKINGITYESKPELHRGSCEGCVAEKNESLCSDVSDEGRCQFSDGVIWIKKEKPMKTTEQTEEPKYTVEDVMGAIEDVTGFQCWNDIDDIDEVKAYLAKQNNPEYKLYLELKAKFGE